MHINVVFWRREMFSFVNLANMTLKKGLVKNKMIKTKDNN